MSFEFNFWKKKLKFTPSRIDALGFSAVHVNNPFKCLWSDKLTIWESVSEIFFLQYEWVEWKKKIYTWLTTVLRFNPNVKPCWPNGIPYWVIRQAIENLTGILYFAEIPLGVPGHPMLKALFISIVVNHQQRLQSGIYNGIHSQLQLKKSILAVGVLQLWLQRYSYIKIIQYWPQLK